MRMGYIESAYATAQFKISDLFYELAVASSSSRVAVEDATCPV